MTGVPVLAYPTREDRMGVHNFHHYLHGRKFLIQTDHGALHWTQKDNYPDGWNSWVRTTLISSIDKAESLEMQMHCQRGLVESTANALER